MLKLLNEVVFHDLKRLLADRSAWNSLHITYEQPHVERLWCQHGGLRVFLHRIWPVTDLFERGREALYHPHPWPSAVRIVSGSYIHCVGTKDKVLCKQLLHYGSEYELVDPETWHSVEPDGRPSDSIMVIGRPYPIQPDMPYIDVPQVPLPQDRFDALFSEWCDRFGVTSRGRK